MSEARYRRAEAFLNLILPGGSNAGQSPAMEGAGRGEDFKATFSMAIKPGDLEKCLVGFSTAVAKENLSAAAGMGNELLCELALRLGIVEVGNMCKFACLLSKRGGNFWICVT